MQIVCFFSSSEIILKVLLLLFYKKKKIIIKEEYYNINTIINYNLKAIDRESVNECIINMHKTFLGNLSRNNTLVLISGTSDINLVNYERNEIKKLKINIYNILKERAIEYINNSENYNITLEINKKNNYNLIWNQYNKKNFRENYEEYCKEIIEKIIYLKRNAKILKKCGQYQDLIKWINGYKYGYTYKDKEIYGNQVRKEEKLFEESYNSLKIFNKDYKYTLILDSDSYIEEGELFKLLNIAEKNSDYIIIQPQIEFHSNKTIFSKIQDILQKNNNIINSYLYEYIGKSNFYGKGLIKNKEYLYKCIGTQNNLIEYIPINAMSHDTFESIILPTLYTDKVSIKELCPENYIAWNIREIRWNYGDIIVGKHIYPKIFCRTNPPMSRNKFKLSFEESYNALSSIRIIFMKPLLLLFIIQSNFIYLHKPLIPMIFMLFSLLIIPSFINLKKIQ